MRRILSVFLAVVLILPCGLSLAYGGNNAFSGEYPVGIGMPIGQFANEVRALVKTASTWTAETVPHFLSEFPLMPSHVFDVFNAVSQAESTINTAGSSYVVWDTGLPALFTDSKPDSTEIWMEYLVDNEYRQLGVSTFSSDSFGFRIPEDMTINDIEGANYSLCWTLPDGWNEVIGILYGLENGVPCNRYTLIDVSNEDCSIAWSSGFSIYAGYDEEIMAVEIFKSTGDSLSTVRHIEYNMRTGRIVRMGDGTEDVIEFNEESFHTPAPAQNNNNGNTDENPNGNHGQRTQAPQSTETPYDPANETLYCSCGGVRKPYYVTNYRQYDDKQHAYGIVEVQRCQSCGNNIFSGGDSIDYEPHQFQGNVCTKCGYDKTMGRACPNCGESMMYEDTYHDIPYNSEYHTSEHYRRDVCEHCGYSTDFVLVDTQLDSHHFNGTDDCSYCGYHDYGD